ncbi:unnamed protein product [Ixodes hexagonus]
MNAVHLVFAAVAVCLCRTGKSYAYPGVCIPVDYCDVSCVAGSDTAGCEICICPPCLPCPTQCYDPAPGCPQCAPLQDCFQWPLAFWF